ncbi:MAG: hypothetical protein ACI4KF_01740 [Huintestinicola sp.]
MFEVTLSDIQKIANEYSIDECPTAFYELQRYNYDEENKDSKEVRLIIKVVFEKHSAVVVRFKNEWNVTKEHIEAQCRFAVQLSKGGIKTPYIYQIDGHYANDYHINGYDVIVTIEDIYDGEVKAVDEKIARMTGVLLAEMHNVSEKMNLHVYDKVMFNPLLRNELFDITVFSENKEILREIEPSLYDEIESITDSYLRKIEIFKEETQYAVQGDISLCNLYITVDGEMGVFDYNNCGDNVLFYDAIMQAVFESRLMDYKDDYPEREQNILSEFLSGYDSVRPFTPLQKEMYPYLCAVISAYWLGDMSFDEGNLKSLIENEQTDTICRFMKNMRDRLIDLQEFPLFG